jgi:hypothetical protein
MGNQMDINIRDCIRALVLSHLDKGSKEALSISLSVRSDIRPMAKHINRVSLVENDSGDDFIGEAFGLANIELIISRPSNYTKVYRKISVFGFKESIEEPMALVANHDSCWIDGAIGAISYAKKKSREMALAEVKETVLPEFSSFYDFVASSSSLNIEKVTRCVILSVEGVDKINSGPVTLNIGPSPENKKFC